MPASTAAPTASVAASSAASATAPVLDAHPMHLANGGYFPDSGYTARDHDQGEVAHWEPFVQAYIQVFRERYKPPFTPEASQHLAFLMGLAAHGITDSTFDSLLYARAEQVDGGDFDSFDLSMDVFIAHDKPRYFVPEYAYVTSALVTVYVDWATTTNTMRIHRVLDPWAEATVSYANFWGTQHFAAAVEATFSAGSIVTRSFDLTGLTSAWVNGDLPNRGILLEEDIGTTPGRHQLYSSEGSIVARRPKLEICYAF